MTLATGVPPSELERWPLQDIIDLMEYDQIQPFGSERDNWHAAMVAQLIAAVNTPKNRRKPEVKDFMFRDPESRRDDKEAELLNWLRAMKRGNKPS